MLVTRSYCLAINVPKLSNKKNRVGWRVGILVVA